MIVEYNQLDENEVKQLRKNAREIYTEISIKNGGFFEPEDIPLPVLLDILGKYIPSIEKNKDAILDWDGVDERLPIEVADIIIEDCFPRGLPEITREDYEAFYMRPKVADYVNNHTAFEIADIVIRNDLTKFFI